MVITGRRSRARALIRFALLAGRKLDGVQALVGQSVSSPGEDQRETQMTRARRFPKSIAAAIHAARILGIRTGTKPHRIIGIWAVVVEGRVFVRSYSLKPRSWWRTFHEEPRGIIEVN